MANLLDVKNVTKRFGGVVANKDVTFSIEAGHINGLIGPNGAGKSTMFNMISNVFPPSAGEIWFEGKRIDILPAFKMASLGISRTFQNIQVFKNMTVLENVMIGLHTRTSAGMLSAALKLPKTKKEENFTYDKAMEHLLFAGLHEIADTFADSLPLGKLRILELARALATEPKLLLLDEIAAGLNHQETVEMGKLIQSIRDRNITILVVEHDMDLVMSICDKVIVLDQGEMIAEGTPKEVQNNERVIEAYLGTSDDEEVSV
ncbi:amino acid/amide ABC transporter ATP-binding protein 1 (HAAT family) [Bacillus oleivorans]|uniref:Amino acid/amide ABC transporter ATP-binding protein 1 (HAAT family) n=1 Tax=Bacillus oleivorans TaxID=1448271 RepID=A0A285CMT5_9BACI|nr:ABC transporter ATP-binding protein [Bacillus oleivorans]SNX68859.1 amino acid/amide ABC transporter ATP-binding protein 1 (HAAT family) [Bacillus oleivorans]